MLYADWVLPMVAGGIFILFGLVGIIWSKREQESYDYRISSRPDLRELVDHWPPRPEPGALKVGGGIAVTIGIVMFLLGVAFLLRG